MVTSRFPLMRRWRLNAVLRRLALAGCAAGVALVILLVDAFVITDGILQMVAFTLTGLAFVAAWSAILAWRMPVFSARTLWSFTAVWVLCLGLAILLVILAPSPPRPLLWQLAVQWLAFSISLFAGALEFRALFCRRATPLMGRILALVSPLAILILAIITASAA